jgi:hypothetical protein
MSGDKPDHGLLLDFAGQNRNFCFVAGVILSRMSACKEGHDPPATRLELYYYVKKLLQMHDKYIGPKIFRIFA